MSVTITGYGTRNDCHCTCARYHVVFFSYRMAHGRQTDVYLLDYLKRETTSFINWVVQIFNLNDLLISM